MAAPITVIKPTSFAGILDAIETFQAGSNVSWYRGCRNSTHRLQPTLFRHPTKRRIEDLIRLEMELGTRFIQRSLPFLERPLSDHWDRMFLMQHYGVPTRLLDWSENPFVSVYFALVSQNEPRATDASFWMCNPEAWNQAVLSGVSFTGGVLDPTNRNLTAYAPGTNVDDIPKLPLMIYGSYNSPRIVAQRGGFSIFGKGTESMEEVYLTDIFPDGVLSKIEIEHGHIAAIRDSLFRKGFTESVVFPDLDGLARELRRAFGF